MEKYLVWFASNRPLSEMRVAAVSREDAIQVFASHHGVNPSSYIQARKLTPVEKAPYAPLLERGK